MAEPESPAVVLPQEDEEGKDDGDKPDEKTTDAVMKSYERDEAEESEPVPQQNGVGGGEPTDGTDKTEDEDEEKEEEEGEGEEQLVVAEEDGDRERLGPRDEIKVTVTGYQRTADGCTFDVEVMFFVCIVHV